MQRVLVELVPSLQPIDLAPLPFGRTAGALVTPPAAGSCGGSGGGVRSSYRMRAISAEPRRSANPITLSTRTVRSSAMVTTSPGRTGRLDAVDARAVDADQARIRQRRSGRARAHHARVPQPFVDALPIQRKTQRSLLPSSCAFKARSLANGEFGSGSLLLRGSSLEPQIRSGRYRVRDGRGRGRGPRRGGTAAGTSLRSGRSRRSGRPAGPADLAGRPSLLGADLGFDDGSFDNLAVAILAFAAIAAAMTRTAVTVLALAVGRCRGICVATACPSAAATAGASPAGWPSGFAPDRSAATAATPLDLARTALARRTAGPPHLDHLRLGRSCSLAQPLRPLPVAAIHWAGSRARFVGSARRQRRFRRRLRSWRNVGRHRGFGRRLARNGVRRAFGLDVRRQSRRVLGGLGSPSPRSQAAAAAAGAAAALSAGVASCEAATGSGSGGLGRFSMR